MNNSEPLVRKYEARDKIQCVDIFKSNFPKYFTAEELPPFEAWLDNSGKDPIYANSEADYYYVVEDENKIVGCGGFYKVRDSREVRFAWGMILNDSHNKGYGTVLHTHRLSRINEMYPQALITLGTSQHTFRFFEKMGFRVTEITPDGYGVGMDKYDMEYNSPHP